jgi:cyanophycinase
MSKAASGLSTLIVLLLVAGSATVAGAQEVGPANGSLVVVGGALRDLAILEEFVELAGGPDAPIVVIPTAGGGDEYDQYCPCLRQLRELGATNLTVLHTQDRSEADSDEFVAPLKEARGVWFSGGRQWRLADSYLGTKVHDELWGVLERGGVIGGSSAGATIQGSYLARGDTETNTIMMGDHEEGLGFLRDVAIDQHLLKRNRQFDLIEVIEAHPELLGIGLDENTAIVVRGDSFRVIGESYVAIYDHSRRLDSGGVFYFLAPGDRYDMEKREAYRMRTTAEPLERVVEEVWPQR